MTEKQIAGIEENLSIEEEKSEEIITTETQSDNNKSIEAQKDKTTLIAEYIGGDITEFTLNELIVLVSIIEEKIGITNEEVIRKKLQSTIGTMNVYGERNDIRQIWLSEIYA